MVRILWLDRLLSPLFFQRQQISFFNFFEISQIVTTLKRRPLTTTHPTESDAKKKLFTLLMIWMP